MIKLPSISWVGILISRLPSFLARKEDLQITPVTRAWITLCIIRIVMNNECMMCLLIIATISQESKKPAVCIDYVKFPTIGNICNLVEGLMLRVSG